MGKRQSETAFIGWSPAELLALVANPDTAAETRRRAIRELKYRGAAMSGSVSVAKGDELPERVGDEVTPALH